MQSTLSSKRMMVVVSVVTLFSVSMSCIAGFIGVYLGSRVVGSGVTPLGSTTVNTTSLIEESTLIDVVEKSTPAVVSIVITKDLPIYENYYEEDTDNFWSWPTLRRRQVGTESTQVGAGTGFIITAQGLIVTNKHVVSDTKASYTVVLNDGTKYEAKVLDRDNTMDIALIEVKPASELPTLTLGDSDNIKVGQLAVSIGNSLGRFSNTVSSGIVSGLARSIVASEEGGSASERLDGVIQTDASINPGNSGGPLLDSGGNVIGVNVAIAANAENIGFAIPINLVKPIIESVQKFGEIRKPALGVRYQVVTPEIATAQKLTAAYGALLVKGDAGEPAVLDGSAAHKAGLQAGDHLLEIDGRKLDLSTLLVNEIQKHSVGDKIEITYARDGKVSSVTVELLQVDED